MIYGHILGGLGNQLFIYAFYRRMMIETNQKVLLYFDSEDGRNLAINNYKIDRDIEIVCKEFMDDFKRSSQYKWYVLFRKLVEHIDKRRISQLIIYIANFFGCLPVLDKSLNINYRILKKKKNIISMCYGQSEKYFLPIKDVLIRELVYEKKLSQNNYILIEKCKNEESVCVHVRRGDYLNPKNKKKFYVCDDKYYEQAIKKIKEKVTHPRYYVFSDDIGWVKANMSFLQAENPVYVDNDGEDSVCLDLEIMRSCKHFIMSNSTLSWWAQYLSDNKEKVVVAPSRWLNDKNYKCELYQDDWNLISV